MIEENIQVILDTNDDTICPYCGRDEFTVTVKEDYIVEKYCGACLGTYQIVRADVEENDDRVIVDVWDQHGESLRADVKQFIKEQEELEESYGLE